MYLRPCNRLFLRSCSAKAWAARFLIALGVLVPLAPSHAQPLISNVSNQAISLSGLTNFTYTQDFDSLIKGANGGQAALTSLNTTALRGLQVARSGGTTNSTNIIVDNGGNTGGSIYSYGTSGFNNRRFGTLTTATSTGDLYYGFRFVNDTNSEILSMDVRFFGEVWRAGQANLTETLQFSSAVFNAGEGGLGAAGYSTAGTGLQYAKQAGSVAGSQELTIGSYGETKSGTITFAAPVASGQEIWIRWKDTEGAGQDNGMSIDDLNVSFTPTPAPPAALSILVGSAVGGLQFGVVRRRNRRRQQKA